MASFSPLRHQVRKPQQQELCDKVPCRHLRLYLFYIKNILDQKAPGRWCMTRVRIPAKVVGKNQITRICWTWKNFLRCLGIKSKKKIWKPTKEQKDFFSQQDRFWSDKFSSENFSLELESSEKKLDNFEAITKKILLLSPPILFFETNRAKADQPVRSQNSFQSHRNETDGSKVGSKLTAKLLNAMPSDEVVQCHR